MNDFPNDEANELRAEHERRKKRIRIIAVATAVILAVVWLIQ